MKMASLEFESDAAKVTLTCSLGVSEWRLGDNIDALLKRADVALYTAKACGRNRVVAADDAFIPAGYPYAGSVIRSSARRVAAHGSSSVSQ